MQELNKLLSHIRTRRAAERAAPAAPEYNFEDRYAQNNPDEAWQLADSYGYLEASRPHEEQWKSSWQRVCSDCGVEEWRDSTPEQHRRLVAHCVQGAHSGHEHCVHALLFLVRGVQCESRRDLAKHLQVARDVTALLIPHYAQLAQIALETLRPELLNLLVTLLVLARADTQLQDAVRNVCIGSVSDYGGTSVPLVDVCFSLVQRYTQSGQPPNFPIKKVLLVLANAVSISFGSHDVITARKRQVRERAGLSADPVNKCRQPDLDDMKKRLARRHGTKRCPVALEEALSVLQTHLYVPVSALREAQAIKSTSETLKGRRGIAPARTIRKVIGSELKVSREHSTDLASFVPVRSGVRRCTKPLDDAAHTPFEAFYRRALPRLQQYVMALIKILIPVLASPETRASLSGLVFDIYGEVTGDDDADDNIVQVDVRRQTAIIANCCSTTLLLLLRQARESHAMQYEYLLSVMADCNLTALLVRFLQQDVTGLCLKPHWFADAQYLFTEPKERPKVNWNYFGATVSCIRLLQKLSKASHMRVRELMNAKMDKTLKGLLNCNPTVKHYALKILKQMFRFFKAKRRLQEGPLITAIYYELKPELNDDWLTTFYLEKDESLLAAEEMLQEAEARKDVLKWNAYHYRIGDDADDDDHGNQDDSMVEEDDDDGEDSVNEMFEKLAASVEVNVPENVEQWVREQVRPSFYDSLEDFESLEK